MRFRNVLEAALDDGERVGKRNAVGEEQRWLRLREELRVHVPEPRERLVGFREVKPLKLLSELLFSSRFILLRVCRLSRGAFGALCAFFLFCAMSSGISEVSKFFPESHSIISARLCLHGNWRLGQEHLNT